MYFKIYEMQLMDIARQAFIEDDNTEILLAVNDVIDIITKLSITAMNQGLLCLEEAVCKYDTQNPLQQFIKHLVNVIVDGTDPDIVRVIGENDIALYANQDIVAYQMLIAFKGLQHIQVGTNTFSLVRILSSYVPLEHRHKLTFDGYGWLNE